MYRISFALFLFHLVHFLVIAAGWGGFHTSMWLIKLLLLIGGIISTFWIPMSFFDGYADFSRFASFFYLLILVVQLIDGAIEYDFFYYIYYIFNLLDGMKIGSRMALRSTW